MGDVFTIISITIQVISFFIRIIVAFFQLVHKLRLTIPVVYYILICTVPSLNKWAVSHEPLAIGILIFLTALSVLSWIYTFVKYIQQLFNNNTSAETEEAATCQINYAQSNNILLDNVNINSNNNNSIDIDNSVNVQNNTTNINVE